MEYRIRFVSDGGPVSPENPKGWPTDCGHKHSTQRATAVCLAKQVKEITKLKLPLGASVQYRLWRGEWRWVSREEENRIAKTAGVI